MTDLNSLIPSSSGWTLESANDINDSGWIVGVGLNPSGQTDAFLLAPVPEPSTVALLLAAALLAGLLPAAGLARQQCGRQPPRTGWMRRWTVAQNGGVIGEVKNHG